MCGCTALDSLTVKLADSSDISTESEPLMAVQHALEVVPALRKLRCLSFEPIDFLLSLPMSLGNWTLALLRGRTGT